MATAVNVLPLGQQLGEALGVARALINRASADLATRVDELRRWYYSRHPEERDRLLWQRFTEATQTHARLEHAIGAAREALEGERRALAQAQAEREALATRPLPTTIEQGAGGSGAEAVRRYQSLRTECQQREAAIAELERLLRAPGQTLDQLTEAVARVLEAVVTVDREAFVRRVRESLELEHLRSRFERLRAAATPHAGEIDEWSQRVGRPLRIPHAVFPWPPAPVWQALLDGQIEAPELLWDEEEQGTPSA